MEQLHPSEIDLGLKRVREVSARLDIFSCSAQANIITIAGTNGKGSCVASLETLLSTQPCRFGSYTSPHFLRYNERIKIDGIEVSDEDICYAFHRIDLARQEISLTYFEFGTLAAFLIFCDNNLDHWILEVGLGGRLDATNIVDANIAVVTPIDLDHQAWLGNTREQVGREKAGIIKPGCTLVCCDPNPPLSVIHSGESVAREVFYFGEDKDFWVSQVDELLQLRVGNKSCAIEVIPQLPLPSVGAALQVAACIGIELPDPVLEIKLSELALTGRNQRIEISFQDSKPISFLLDVAHNPHAAGHLSKLLKNSPRVRRRAIVSAMSDKDIQSALSKLTGQFETWYFCDLDGNNRAAKAADLQIQLSEVSDNEISVVCASVEEAISKIFDERRESGCAEQIVVFGSFFTVAEALQVLQEKGLMKR